MAYDQKKSGQAVNSGTTANKDILNKDKNRSTGGTMGTTTGQQTGFGSQKPGQGLDKSQSKTRTDMKK